MSATGHRAPAASATAISARWTTHAAVLQALRTRWDSGEFLRAHARGEPWPGISVPLRGPSASELSAHFEAAQRWATSWEAAASRATAATLRLEHRTVGGRLVGANRLPARAVIDGYEALWTILGTTTDVVAFDELISETEKDSPQLVPWMREHPMNVLAAAPDWPRLVKAAVWIATESGRARFLREIDVPGVDTKFIESNRSLLGKLAEQLLEPDQIALSRPIADFAGRYGFRKKPEYVRFRHLDPGSLDPGSHDPGSHGAGSSFSELTVRVDELATRTPAVSTVYIIENEITYLALPPTRNAIAIFGAGYSVARLKPLAWLNTVTVRYWGDLDTHGFSILSQLRGYFGQVESMLMDRATLLAHEQQWVTEPKPTAAALANLAPAEAELYADLVENRYGVSIRLEQERISFADVSRWMRT